MITRSNLESQLKEAKLNLKLWDSAELIVDSFLKKEKYEFITFGIEVKLFENRLFSMGDLTLRSKNFSHYLEMGIDDLSKSEKMEIRKIKAAVVLLERNEDAAWNILLSLSNEKLKK